jgi:dTMP kinase
MNRGLFITLEGGEGAGKSTAARFIADWFSARGREVVSTREPGGSPLAEAIRQVVLADWPEGVPADTELLLMFAARAAHLSATIRPALARGAVVVSDRFVDASWAYQGAGRGIADARIAALEADVLGATRPDLTLLFDLDPAIGLARAKGRGDTNRFEAESLAFQARIRAAYRMRAETDPERYRIIDAEQPVETVQQALAQALRGLA